MISFILVWLTISTDFYWGSIFKTKIIIQWSSMVVNLHRRRVRLWKQREVLLSQRSLLWSRHGNTDTKERWNLSFRWNAPSSGQRGIMISLSKIFQLIATKILYQIYNTIWESKIHIFNFVLFSVLQFCQLFRIRSRASSVSPISSTSSSPQSVSPTFDQRNHQYLPARKPYRCVVMV